MKASDLAAITKTVTKKWTAQRKREKRNSSARFHRSEYMYSNRVYQTDIAWQVIPKAYAKASSDGRLPAHARQIYYAARGEIQKRTGRPLESQYFTQTLLPKYVNEHPEATNWRIVYDARGNLTEPHTKERVPLGTIEVTNYLRGIQSHKADSKFEFTKQFKDEFPTKGPVNRFGAVLFIEKEGFNPLFEEVKLMERYDLAIMSTKGQSVVAAHRLVDSLCCDKVVLLVLHDFDKSGLEIAQSLTSVSAAAEWANRVRYEFANTVNVIDLGLRLADVEEWNLEPESVQFKGQFGPDSIATPEEQEFLQDNQRVELNAFTSEDFITWIESKLEEHGIKKVVPGGDVLEDAYRRAYQIALINRQLAEIRERAAEEAEKVNPSDGLADAVRNALEQDPERSWDEVVAELAAGRVAAGVAGKTKSKEPRKRRSE